MKKFGPYLGLLAIAALAVGIVMTPASCALTPEQSALVRSITVPVTAIGLGYARSEGWVEPGDVITIRDGVAVVTAPGSREQKLHDLTKIGLDHAIQTGLVHEGDIITVKPGENVSILSPPNVITTAGK